MKEGGPALKMTMEELLQGGTFHAFLDEQIVFNELENGEEAVWSLLLASGYLKALSAELNEEQMKMEYELKLTNRESGPGRYDIMVESRKTGDAAFIMEFKVVDVKRKETLEDGVRSALRQIEEKQYEAVLQSRGIAPERIRKYGFAFEGSSVLIGKG